MKYKFLISLITSLSTAICLNAQNAEPTDSLTRELQEIVVTAKQPATKLIGTTLVSTIAGSNLAEIGNARSRPIADDENTGQFRSRDRP